MSFRLRVIGGCGLLAVGAPAHAACTFTGTPGPYIQCIYDEVQQLRVEIDDLSLRMGAVEADQEGVAFRVGPAADQNIGAPEDLLMTLDVRVGTLDIDTHGGWDAAADHYTVPVGGVWQVSGACSMNNVPAGNWVVAKVIVNGTQAVTAFGHSEVTQDVGANASTTVAVSAGDTLPLVCAHSGVHNQFFVASGDSQSFLMGHRIGD